MKVCCVGLFPFLHFDSFQVKASSLERVDGPFRTAGDLFESLDAGEEDGPGYRQGDPSFDAQPVG